MLGGSLLLTGCETAPHSPAPPPMRYSEPPPR